jgi:hypothetical protein
MAQGGRCVFAAAVAAASDSALVAVTVAAAGPSVIGWGSAACPEHDRIFDFLSALNAIEDA